MAFFFFSAFIGAFFSRKESQFVMTIIQKVNLDEWAMIIEAE